MPTDPRATPAPPAPPTTLPSIDLEALTTAAERGSFSGLVALDAPGQDPVTHAFGHAHRGLEVPHTRSTRFALASGGKTSPRWPCFGWSRRGGCG